MTAKQLQGFDEFDKMLKELPGRVSGRVVQKSVLSAIRIGAKEIKRVAPVHSGTQSPASEKYGSLKKNIRVISLKKTKKGEKAARVDTGNAFWALFLHFGTRYIKADHWLTGAFKSAEPKMLDKLKDMLGKGIEKEALKLKRGAK